MIHLYAAVQPAAADTRCGKYIQAAHNRNFLTRLVGPHYGDRTAQTVTVSKAATTPS
jgi:hypothetical protein